MNLGLINSAWAQSGRETSFGIQKTKEIGFDTIDIFADPLDIDIKERKLIKDASDRMGLPIISVCCVAVGLIDLNPSVRRFHLDRAKKYLDMVYEFEGRNLLLVLGEYIWQREVIPPAEQWSWAVDHVHELGRYAFDLGLEIALEMEPFHESLLNDVVSMSRFLDEVDHPSVKANVDISHMVLAEQQPSALEKLRGRIAHIHISDCDGQVHGDLPPGRGVVEFPDYLKAIKNLNLEDVTMSIELEYAPEPDKIVDWVREAYESTSRLMREAGLRGLIRGMHWMRREGAVGSILSGALLAVALVIVLGWPLAATLREVVRGVPESQTGGGYDPFQTPGGPARPLGLAFETIRLVLATEALALPLGVGIAILLFRTDLWGRRVLVGLAMLSMFVPMPLHATAWLGAIGNVGRSQVLGVSPLLLGWTGAAFVHAMAAIPWVVLLAGVGLRAVEPELEESALLDMSVWRVLGA